MGVEAKRCINECNLSNLDLYRVLCSFVTKLEVIYLSSTMISLGNNDLLHNSQLKHSTSSFNKFYSPYQTSSVYKTYLPYKTYVLSKSIKTCSSPVPNTSMHFKYSSRLPVILTVCIVQFVSFLANNTKHINRTQES